MYSHWLRGESWALSNTRLIKQEAMAVKDTLLHPRKLYSCKQIRTRYFLHHKANDSVGLPCCHWGGLLNQKDTDRGSHVQWATLTGTGSRLPTITMPIVLQRSSPWSLFTYDWGNNRGLLWFLYAGYDAMPILTLHVAWSLCYFKGRDRRLMIRCCLRHVVIEWHNRPKYGGLSMPFMRIKPPFIAIYSVILFSQHALKSYRYATATSLEWRWSFTVPPKHIHIQHLQVNQWVKSCCSGTGFTCDQVSRHFNGVNTTSFIGIGKNQCSSALRWISSSDDPFIHKSGFYAEWEVCPFNTWFT